MTRPELTHGVVEYVAPQEYMVRPPQPVVLLFVIDVTFTAIQSGMLAVAAKAIRQSLMKIPDADGRARIGFITFDSALHFYNLSVMHLTQTELTEPQMMVVPDIDEAFLPLPSELLVSIGESRPMIEMFLEKLPKIHAHSQSSHSVLGKALKFAEKAIVTYLMQTTMGGKIICLLNSLPNLNDGSLQLREDPKLFGTPKEVSLLQPAIAFYKNLAVECSPAQISIDMFFFNSRYCDIATLSTLYNAESCPKFTGGNVYYYPSFTAQRPEDAIKFEEEFSRVLTRPLGLEAVLRVRASNGIKMTAFHGNFFLRSTDLLALPAVNPDNSYAIEMQIVESFTMPSVCFQTALLYTNSNGERRIRVLTLSLPVTSSIAEVYTNADQIAIAALLSKKAVDRSLTSKLDDAREALFYKLTEILAVYKTAFNQSTHSAQMLISESLQLLPVLILAMIKHVY
jgi:protein transport protein SEC24